MRQFLGGVVLGGAVGALAVLALGPCGAEVSGGGGDRPAPATPAAAPAREAETAHATAPHVAAHAADPSPARPEVADPADAPAGTRANAARRPRLRAAPPEETAPGESVPEQAEGEDVQVVSDEVVQGWVPLRISKSQVISVDFLSNLSARFTNSGGGARSDLLNALGQLGWEKRAEPAATAAVAAAASLLELCRRAAAAHVEAGGADDAATARRLLASPETGAAEIAIGLADRGAYADVLASALRDVSLATLRTAAGASAAERCADDRAAAEALVAMGRDDDPALRAFAESAFARLGARGWDAAADRLIAGDFFHGDLPGLAPAAMSSARRAEVLASLRDPTAILACCSALRGGDFRSAELAPIGRLLPGILDPVFLSAEGADMIGFAADVLAGAAPDALITLASSSRYPPASRSEALDRAVRHAGSPDVAQDRIARLFTSADLTPDLFAAAVGDLDPEAVTSPRFASLFRELAERSRDPWVREAARVRVQASLPRETADVVLHSAVYGVDVRTVDVTAALRSRFAAGRLVERVGNHLAGDPAFGIVKVLHAEWTAGGRRYARDFPEGSEVRIP